MTLPLTYLQRKPAMILNKLCPAIVLFFLAAIIPIAQAQQPDEGSAVAAETVSVDAAVNGDLSTPAAEQPAKGSVEANIEKEMEPQPETPAPAAAPAKKVETNTVNEAGDAVADEAFKDAVSAGIEKAPAPEASKPVQQAVAEEPEIKNASHAAATPAASPATGLSPKLGNVMMEESLRRQALEEHAKESLKEAEKALEGRDYESAAKLFDEAKKYLGGRSGTEVEQQMAKKGLGESYYKWALVLRRNSDLNGARQKANRALEERYPNAEKLIVSIDMELKEPPPKKVTAPPMRWKEDSFKEKQKTIAELLSQGRQYFLSGELDNAQDMYERVLKRDPYNTEAIRLLEKVNQKRYDAASVELDATRTKMMVDARKTWNPRDYGLMEKVGAPGGAQSTPTRTVDTDRTRILEKMDKIKIREIDFRQANINDVVTFHQSASVEYDESEASEDKKGVNIILNLGTGAGAPPPSAEPTLGAAEPASAAASPVDVPLITFSARYISLLEALKIVTSVANLKYRIDDTVVMIVPKNFPDGAIITRTYDVLPTVDAKIKTLSEEAGKPTGKGGNEPEKLGSQSAELERTDWKEFFEGMGVPWPEGSKIKYIPSIAKIVVANTADNLTIFEKILAQLNVVPTQVEIEARFVEVRQTEMNSLGFEWLLNDNWEIAQQKGASGVIGAVPRIQMNANSGNGGITSGLRFANTTPTAATSLAGGTGGGGTVADNIATLSSVLTNPELSLVIHALEQKGDADLLSAPKVTTQSGQEATIKVVTEYIYPTEFTVTPITGSTPNGGTYIIGGVVEPGGFETREVGVILKVQPEVSAEGMITLTMSPEVVTDPDWKEYGTTYTDQQGNTEVLSMQQPFFHTRAVTTSISIYNGATVVMGGLIDEIRSTTDDKIPFLGDLPLVGRLFRSKIDASDKRNLLIFVTARLVDPAGRPVLPAAPLPDAPSTP